MYFIVIIVIILILIIIIYYYYYYYLLYCWYTNRVLGVWVQIQDLKAHISRWIGVARKNSAIHASIYHLTLNNNAGRFLYNYQRLYILVAPMGCYFRGGVTFIYVIILESE